MLNFLVAIIFRFPIGESHGDGAREGLVGHMMESSVLTYYLLPVVLLAQNVPAGRAAPVAGNPLQKVLPVCQFAAVGAPDYVISMVEYAAAYCAGFCSLRFGRPAIPDLYVDASRGRGYFSWFYRHS